LARRLNNNSVVNPASGQTGIEAHARCPMSV
jgi:hypothetical protein